MNFQLINIQASLVYGGIDYDPTIYILVGSNYGNTTLDDAIKWNGLPENKPTDQQITDWEIERIAIVEADNTSRDNIKESLEDYSTITLQDYELVVSIEQQCAGVFIKGQNPTIDTMHATLVSLLQGSPLATPTMNYIKRVAVVANIGEDLPREFNVAMQFLRIIKGAYETKSGR